MTSGLADLATMKSLLLKAFQRSLAAGNGAVHRGGPGGFSVVVGDERWNVGFSPSETFFASNGQDPGADYCGYHLDADGELMRNTSATPIATGHWVDLDAAVPVDLAEEVEWLLRLIDLANRSNWGDRVALPSRPKPYL